MKKYIECEAAIKEIYRFDGYLDDDMIWRLHYALRKIPAADVAPVRHGRWIEKRWSTEDDWGVINWHSLTCSACDHEERTNGLSPNSIYKYDYCPHCGAKMDGTKNE